jgi:hypothetical protein
MSLPDWTIMFQLEFFKIVRKVFENVNEPCTYLFKNEHESCVLRKGVSTTQPQPRHNNRILIEYIQWTYPEYFGINIHFPRYLVKNRNNVPKQQQLDLFFE